MSLASNADSRHKKCLQQTKTPFSGPSPENRNSLKSSRSQKLFRNTEDGNYTFFSPFDLTLQHKEFTHKELLRFVIHKLLLIACITKTLSTLFFVALL